MFLIVEPDDRERLPGLIKPAHRRSTIQIAAHDLIRHVASYVLGEHRMGVGGIDVKEPGGKSADRIDGFVAENGLHGAARGIEEPKTWPGRPLKRVVEVDALLRVVEHGVGTIRRFEGAVLSGRHVNDANGAKAVA